MNESMYFLLKMGDIPASHVSELRVVYASVYFMHILISHVRQGLNSHYFHIIGDKLINPIP